jgi:outer membrane protein insertion porin family
MGAAGRETLRPEHESVQELMRFLLRRDVEFRGGLRDLGNLLKGRFRDSSRFFSLGLVLYLALLTGLIPERLLGQAPAPPQRIEEIRVVGNRRIPESTILYYIQSKANDPYSEQQILRDYRSILNTNFFSDAKVMVEEGETGQIIIFEVTERPLIRALEYDGMKSFKESDVLEKFRDLRVGLTVDSPFDEAKVPAARKALRLLLDLNGRPLGRVEIDVESITSSSVRLIFRIDEGPKVRIGDIRFEGNTVLSDDELRGALELNKERGPIVMFKGHDKYMSDKLEYDVQVNLLAKYRELGYMMAKAGDPKVEIVEGPQGLLFGFRKTRQQYYITIPIEEGDLFRIGEFDVTGVTTFNEENVKRGFQLRKGDVVNYTQLKEATDRLKELYSTLGFLDMDARPDVRPDMEQKTVDITISVTEGKRYIVNQINFSGNTKTRDKVLRREFLLEEQQEFNGQLLEISVRRLNQLGFFEEIKEEDYDVQKRPDEGEVDVLVKVKERSQQSIGFTGGVSGYSGGFVGVNYQTNNFRGRGERIDVQVMVGTRSSNFMFSYTQPYFLDSKISLGVSVFNQRFRFDTYTLFFGLVGPDNNVPLYTRKSTGFTLSGGYPLGRWTRGGLRYSLQNIRIQDIADIYEPFALNQLLGFAPGGDVETAKDGIIRSEITPSYVYNSKNSYFTATQGSQLSLELPLAGGPLGGSFNLIRPFAEYQHFKPDYFLSGGRHTFAFRLRVSHIIPYGKLKSGDPMSPPFFERFFSGGEFSLRGFNIRSVSPWAVTRAPRLDGIGNPLIDPSTGLPSIAEQIIPVGGDTLFLGTAEYRIPIVGPLQLNAFVDAGTSTIFRKENLLIFGPETFVDLLENTNHVFRMSTGAEIQFLLPVVNQPFRLIFAYNPLKLDTEVTFGGVNLPLREPNSNVRFTVGYNF